MARVSSKMPNTRAKSQEHLAPGPAALHDSIAVFDRNMRYSFGGLAIACLAALSALDAKQTNFVQAQAESSEYSKALPTRLLGTHKTPSSLIPSQVK